jgi:hypothetical protein
MNGVPGMIRSAIWFQSCTGSRRLRGFMAEPTHGAHWMPLPFATESDFSDGFRADRLETPEKARLAVPKTLSPPFVSLIEWFVFSLIFEARR